ncbi:MAG: UPF0179 family protein [Promethearchaeota archaeon]
MEAKKQPGGFISFVGKSNAIVGFQFVYQGSHPACTGCTLFGVCQKFEYLRRYRVAEVRDKELPCERKLHVEPMKVVRVEDCLPTITWPKRGAFVGTSLTFQPRVCDLVECPHFMTCVPPYGIRPYDRFRITRVVRDITPECGKGYELDLCEVEKVPEF